LCAFQASYYHRGSGATFAVGVDEYISRGYIRGGPSWVSLYVGYYRSQRRERVEINRLIVQKGLDRQLVLYWYQAHGRIVASEYWGKIYTVVDAIRLNRSDGTFVRVIVPISSQDAAAEQAAERAALEFVSTFLPILSKHLDG